MIKRICAVIAVSVGMLLMGIKGTQAQQQRAQGGNKKEAGNKARSGNSARAGSTAKKGKAGSARAASGGKSKASSARAATGGKSRAGSARAATAGKSKTSSARAASGGKSRAGSARAAAAGRAKASTAGRARAAIRSRARVTGMGVNADAGLNNRVVEVVVQNPCPFNKAVQKIWTDEGDPEFYKKKSEKCDAPSNTVENQWTKAQKEAMPLPTFIQEDEAVYFTCAQGYIIGKVAGVVDGKDKKVDACINTADFCPLNVVLARAKSSGDATQEEKVVPLVVRGGRRGLGAALVSEAPKIESKDGQPTLKNPRTDMICMAPANAKLRGIASSPTAVVLECPAGQYSDVIAVSSRPDHLECKRCPDGKTSLKGSFNIADCHKSCDDGLMVDPANGDNCIPCSENAGFNGDSRQCVCNPGFVGVGYGEAGCEPCPIGSYCPGGRVAESCDFTQNMYSSEPGLTECKFCPPDASATDGTDCACVRAGFSFDQQLGSCVAK